SLSPERTPQAEEVVRAVLRAGALPGGPEDEAWDDVPRFYIPLVGQIIEQPRWFAPTVSTVWVQAAHNGEELALRLEWDDPSRSPDPAWEPWRQRIADVMEPKEEPAPASSLPDAFAVQLGTLSPQGDLPYFLMGDARTPVHIWRWRSDNTIAEGTARGLDNIEQLSNTMISGSSRYVDGQWQLVLRRALPASDDAHPALAAGQPIPIAFYAWDGSNGESGKRGAIGSWYFLYLEEPASANVWI